MPAKRCEECSIKLGIFKRKLQCRKCLRHFCQSCSNSIRNNEESLQETLQNLTGFNCLSCVILACNLIRKQNLFLLSRKHLSDFLHGKNISTTRCREKNDLIDLVIEHAKVNNIISEQDLADEHTHNTHLNHLRENAERLRLQENEENGQGSSSSREENVNIESNDVSVDDDNNEEIPRNIEVEDASENIITTENTVGSQNVNMNNEVNDDSVTQHDENSGTYIPEPSPARPVNMDDHTNHNVTFTEHREPAQSTVPPPSSTDDSKRRRWKSMDDINDEGEISQLSVFELKQVLTANFIDYKGCCEKKELIDRVKMLYQSCQTILKDAASKDTEKDSESYERDVCKICMDRVIDCVLLDCGHLVVCVKCGKRLNECPICRQLVVRVVHIFRV